MTEEPIPVPERKSLAEKYPPWLVITAAVFVCFIIGAAVVLILTNHTLDEYIQFISSIWSGVLALFAAGGALSARNTSRDTARRVNELSDNLAPAPVGKHHTIQAPVEPEGEPA